MLQRKRAKYIESFRKAHRQNFKVSIRNSLLSSLSIGRETQYEHYISFKPQVIQSILLSQEQFISQEQKRQHKTQEIEALITNLKEQMQKEKLGADQQIGSIPYFTSLIASFRKTLIHDIGKMDSELAESVFQFIRRKIYKAIHHHYCQYFQLQSESTLEAYGQCLHLLRLTITLLVSQYINQGGNLTELSTEATWVVRQFYKWINELKQKLSKVIGIELQSCYNQKNVLAIRQTNFFMYYLKELKCFTYIINHYKNVNFEQVVLHIFSPELINNLVTFLQSYHTTDEMQFITLEILIDIGDLQIPEYFKNLIKADFIDYAKLRLVLLQDYKNVRECSKLSQTEKTEIMLVEDILLVLSQICYSCTSAILWSKGICAQLKYVVDEISNPKIRDFFIQFLLYSVIHLQNVELIQGLNKIDMMGWTMRVLQDRIQRLSIGIQQQAKDVIVMDCLSVLKIFHQVGEQERRNNVGLSANPYLIKLKYLRGDVILSQFIAGQNLLNEFFKEEVL